MYSGIIPSEIATSNNDRNDTQNVRSFQRSACLPFRAFPFIPLFLTLVSFPLSRESGLPHPPKMLLNPPLSPFDTPV